MMNAPSLGLIINTDFTIIYSKENSISNTNVYSILQNNQYHPEEFAKHETGSRPNITANHLRELIECPTLI